MALAQLQSIFTKVLQSGLQICNLKMRYIFNTNTSALSFRGTMKRRNTNTGSGIKVSSDGKTATVTCGKNEITVRFEATKGAKGK